MARLHYEHLPGCSRYDGGRGSGRRQRPGAARVLWSYRGSAAEQLPPLPMVLPQGSGRRRGVGRCSCFVRTDAGRAALSLLPHKGVAPWASAAQLLLPDGPGAVLGTGRAPEAASKLTARELGGGRAALPPTNERGRPRTPWRGRRRRPTAALVRLARTAFGQWRGAPARAREKTDTERGSIASRRDDQGQPSPPAEMAVDASAPAPRNPPTTEEWPPYADPSTECLHK